MLKGLTGIVMVPFFILSLSVSAQENTVSPYSRLGLGDFYTNNLARTQGMGGAILGVRDALNLNPANPASYNALELTTFEIGFEASIIEQVQESPAINSSNSSSGLRYFAVGVPLKDWWGLGFGIQPYSFKGYNISQQLTVADTIDVTESFIGSGGLNKIFFGNSFEVAKGLSLGFNAGYIFGKVQESTVTDWNGNFFDTESDLVVNVKGFQFNFGGQYVHDLAENRELVLGLTFSNSSSLDAEHNLFTYTSLNNRSIDSLTNTGSSNSEVTLPTEFGIGLAYGQRIEQSSNYAWLLSADFETYNGESFVNYDNSQPFTNAFKAEVGGYIIPRYAFKGLNRSNSYLGKVEYRLGAFYHKTPIEIVNASNPNGTVINDYGITFGIGLPIRAKNLAPGERKINTINTGLVLGRRGQLGNGLIQENYLNIYVGITLNDKWFIKYKYR